MFDGQHKTIASWMRDYEVVTIKLYLDMTAKKANELVISIQSRIKKLSLTPFESALKMSEEWQARIAVYVDDMKKTGGVATESGYIGWLPPGPQRNHGKTALKNALLQQVLDIDDFKLSVFVETPGLTTLKTGLKESMLKSRFLEKLLVTTPLDEPIERSDADRQQAVGNIVWMSNLFLDVLFDDSGGDIPEEVLKRKRERFFNQNTLEQVADLMRTIFVRATQIEEGANLSVELSESQRAKIEEQVLRLASHPWWTAEWERDNFMRALLQANQKNQDRKKAFGGIAFDLGYALMGDEYPVFDERWIRASSGEDDD
jgi:hypothetical protein